MKLDPHLTLHIKKRSKRLKDLNLKVKTKIFSEETLEKSSCHWTWQQYQEDDTKSIDNNKRKHR